MFAAAGEMRFWEPTNAVMGTTMFLIAPICLIFFNSFGVEVLRSHGQRIGTLDTDICRYTVGSKSSLEYSRFWVYLPSSAP